ncbi:MAG TPA: hypothetical protein PKB02_01460 [Anaerohalosphaeraceae bacterium]|nr:hypothetical protein [Anaerohalosphaeraceae bacterium]
METFLDLFSEIIGIPAGYNSHHTDAQPASCILREFLSSKKYLFILFRFQTFQRCQIRKVTTRPVNFMKYRSIYGGLFAESINNFTKPFSLFLLGCSFNILNRINDHVPFTFCPFMVGLTLYFKAVAFTLFI